MRLFAKNGRLNFFGVFERQPFFLQIENIFSRKRIYEALTFIEGY